MKKIYEVCVYSYIVDLYVLYLLVFYVFFVLNFLLFLYIFMYKMYIFCLCWVKWYWVDVIEKSYLFLRVMFGDYWGIIWLVKCIFEEMGISNLWVIDWDGCVFFFNLWDNFWCEILIFKFGFRNCFKCILVVE